MSSDILPALSRMWIAPLHASLALLRMTERFWSRSLDACFFTHQGGIQDRDCCLLDSMPGPGLAQAERFREAEEAVGELALSLRGGKVERLEAMIQAIDRAKQRRSSFERAP